MKRFEKFEETSTSAPPVRGFLYRPNASAAAGLVLTHGAGSNCQAPLLVALANEFCEAGWLVLRCDLPFRQARPHGPPARGSAERDQAGLRAAVEILRRETNARIYVGGHSYGGRQASMMAATEPGVADALLLLSYPLHPPERTDALRTEHLPQLRTPCFFAHGTNDGFGSIDEMQEAIRLIPARTQFLPIAGAGHELLNKRNRGELAGLIANSFKLFVAG